MRTIPVTVATEIHTGAGAVKQADPLLQHWHPIWALAASLPNPVTGKAVENGPSPWEPAPMWETRKEFLAPSFTMAQFWPLQPFGMETLCNSAFPSKIISFKNTYKKYIHTYTPWHKFKDEKRLAMKIKKTLKKNLKIPNNKMKTIAKKKERMKD